MPLRWSPHDFEKRAAQFRQLSDPVPLNKELAEESLALADEQFNREGGPYGARWKVSQRVRRFGGRTLHLSGDLQRNKDARADRSGWWVTFRQIYAAVHQFGWKKRNIAARPFLPLQSRGIPGTWLKRMQGRVDEHIRKIFR